MPSGAKLLLLALSEINWFSASCRWQLVVVRQEWQGQKRYDLLVPACRRFSSQPFLVSVFLIAVFGFCFSH
jgi:hypothetical protein